MMRLDSTTIAGALVILLLIFPGYTASTQGQWNNKKCAVCLTYDDALNVHLDNAVPALDSLGFKATFYLSGFFPSFRERSTEWRVVAAKGHELGNHTLFHPCEGRAPGREWVKPDYDLNTYTMKRLLDEIKMANTLLTAIDGKTKRTFAYTCGDKKVSDSSFVDRIRTEFIAARAVEDRIQSRDGIDLCNIPSYMINGQSGEELINLVRKGMESNGLVVFLFHGVGGEHNLNVSLEAHSRLLHFLKQNEKDIWIAPMIEIGEYVKQHPQK
jgi:sialate O-acetylesterase